MNPATMIADAMLLFAIAIDIFMRWRETPSWKDLEAAKADGYAEGYKDGHTDNHPDPPYR